MGNTVQKQTPCKLNKTIAPETIKQKFQLDYAHFKTSNFRSK